MKPIVQLTTLTENKRHVHLSITYLINAVKQLSENKFSKINDLSKDNHKMFLLDLK